MKPPSLLSFALVSVIVTSSGIATAEPAAQGFAVVELFTSQGCSSCPPADRVLAELAERGGTSVLCLSFHVDYWNRLGWTDPFSRPEFSERQRTYARRWGSHNIYTPQMVVNGTVEFVGSDRRLAQDSVAHARKTPAEATLKLRLLPGGNDASQLQIAWETASPPAGSVINLALVERSAGNEVPVGENRGRALQHRNVVREFHTLAATAGSGEATLPLPAGMDRDHLSVIGYLQGPNQGAISAAAQLGLAL